MERERSSRFVEAGGGAEWGRGGGKNEEGERSSALPMCSKRGVREHKEGRN